LIGFSVKGFLLAAVAAFLLVPTKEKNMTRITTILVCVLLVTFAFTTVAAADPPASGTLVLNPSSISAGSTYNASGCGYSTTAVYKLVIQTPLPSVETANLVIDSNGCFTADLISDSTPGDYAHTVYEVRQGKDRAASPTVSLTET
jgi:hypothetical protein